MKNDFSKDDYIYLAIEKAKELEFSLDSCQVTLVYGQSFLDRPGMNASIGQKKELYNKLHESEFYVVAWLIRKPFLSRKPYS